MRKKLLLSFAVVFGLLTPLCANAGFYMELNGGNGGAADASSGGVEFGVILYKFLIGAGIARMNNDYRERGESTAWGYNYYKHEKEEEVYLAIGGRVAENWLLVLDLGVSQQRITFESAMDADFDEDPESFFAVGGQVLFNYEHLLIGVGYENRRGVVGSVGFAF